LRWLGIGRRKNGLKSDPALSDAELVERLKQRDERAFMMLYDLHRTSVYRFLMHMTGSSANAEELTQEVFVVILESMCAETVGQFNPGRGTWEGYLLGIARNLARAERRRTNRAVSLENIIETPEWERMLNAMFQDNRTWDVASLMAARSELRILHRAILELPDHYREAVVLCSLQEKSYRDAAMILECSEGTVASRMNRAKAILAAKLRSSRPNKLNASGGTQRKEGADVGTASKANRN
jgi:RNA polymerase sigma-70 factor (ECF subfamily)